MDTRLIQTFVLAARHLSFTRAGDASGISQSQVSRLVRRLEDDLGVDLFDRSGHRVALTPAGEAFLAEAQDLLDHVGIVRRRTTLLGQNRKRTLRVGYTTAVPDQPCWRGLRDFARRYPTIQLELVRMSAEQQADALRAGQLEVGLLQFIGSSRQGLAWRTVGRSRFVLAVPDDWAIPTGRPVDLADLADRPFVLSNPDYAPEVNAAQLTYCRQAGFTPRIACFARERVDLVFHVAAGFGACFLFEQAMGMRFDGVQLLPLARHPPAVFADLEVVWLDHELTEPVAALVDSIAAQAHEAVIVPAGEAFGLEWRRCTFD